MRRFVSEHFKLNGLPKKALTKEKALARAAKAKKDAYRCGFCGAWHIGGRA